MKPRPVGKVYAELQQLSPVTSDDDLAKSVDLLVELMVSAKILHDALADLHHGRAMDKDRDADE